MIREESSWEIKKTKSYPQLTDNIKADIVIIGAGMTGIFNAYVLSKAGMKVVVLEKNENILQNTTLYTTAFITKVIDTSFDGLVSLFGEDKSKLVWQSGQDALDSINDIVKREAIDCEFKFVPVYTYAQNQKELEKLNKEYRSLKNSGFDANFQTNGDKLNFKNAGFMEIPMQAKFHPIKFAHALADRAESFGAKIFTNSKVLTINGLNVKTNAGQVQSNDVIIATYSPLINEGTRFKKGMYVSYVYDLETTKGLIPEGLYLDMSNPYHYFRIDSYEDFDRMIVGGEDHRRDIKVNPEKNFKALEKYIKGVLDGNPYTIKRKWSGQILESVDGLPLIGKIKPRIYVATAFSGNGMTYSAVAAPLIRDSILGHKNPYSQLYNPKRIATLKQLLIKGRDYGKEFFGGAFTNFFRK